MNLRDRAVRGLLGAAVLLGAASCSSSPASSPSEAPDSDAGADTRPCAARPEAEATACAEAQFWAAFRQADLAPRQASEATLRAVIAAYPTPTRARPMSLMHFRLGQMRLALALENGQRDYVLHSKDMIVGEFDEATALDAYDGIIAPWKDTMEMAMVAVLQDWTDAVPLAERGFANVALNPMGNTLSLSGTTIGFPLSTNVPQRTAKLLDDWTCQGVDWCTKNTDHAPFARPGLSYHFAEAYARVGNRGKTVQYLDAAVASPGFDVWPYRHVVDDAKKDVDAFLAKFAALGQDGSAIDIVYANQPYGCLFCHAVPR